MVRKRGTERKRQTCRNLTLLEIWTLCVFLIILRNYYPKSLLERYGIEEISEDHQVLEQIATRRGLKSAGELDIEKAEITLLKDFKDGRLGLITLDRC